MPDHDTRDLDAAFARLEQEITALSTAPGAGAAVARARRRRRTTVGVVAAVVGLIVAGTAGGAYIHRQNAGDLASLPGATAFDPDALSAASSEWASDWAVPTKADEKTLGAMAKHRTGKLYLTAAPHASGRLRHSLSSLAQGLHQEWSTAGLQASVELGEERGSSPTAAPFTFTARVA